MSAACLAASIVPLKERARKIPTTWLPSAVNSLNTFSKIPIAG